MILAVRGAELCSICTFSQYLGIISLCTCLTIHCNKEKCVKNFCYALLSPQNFNGKIMYSLMCTLDVELKFGNINGLHTAKEYRIYSTSWVRKTHLSSKTLPDSRKKAFSDTSSLK